MNATVEAVGSNDVQTIGELELGVIMDLLRSRRRRLVLDALTEGGETDYSEVVEYVTREEVGLGFGRKDRKRVYVALYQNHLPKLREAGVVEFEGSEGPVQPGPRFEDVTRALETLRDEAEERGVEDEGSPRPRFRTLRELLSGQE